MERTIKSLISLTEISHNIILRFKEKYELKNNCKINKDMAINLYIMLADEKLKNETS